SDHRRIGAAGPLSSGDDEDPPRVPGGSAGGVDVEAKRLAELDLRLGITLAANGVEEVAADLGGRAPWVEIPVDDLRGGDAGWRRKDLRDHGPRFRRLILDPRLVGVLAKHRVADGEEIDEHRPVLGIDAEGRVDAVEADRVAPDLRVSSQGEVGVSERQVGALAEEVAPVDLGREGDDDPGAVIA